MTGRGSCLSDAQKPTQRVYQYEETEIYVPNEKQNNILERDFNEMEVGILPDKRVQSKVIKMLIELRKSMNTLRTSIRDRKYLTSTTFNCGVGKDS